MAKQRDSRNPHGLRARLPASAPSGYVTYEAFLDWGDEDTLAEWVDGTIEMTSPASLRHQHMARFVQTMLATFVEVHALGAIIAPPFQMKLPRSGREPDAIYVAQAHLDRLRPTYLDGPADLVVEIVSPESVKRDHETKFGEYEQAGIPEYWLLDPETEQAQFYQRDGAGRYRHSAPAPDGVYRSRVLPGFWLRTSWLWQQPLPDMVQALLEVDRDAYGEYLRARLQQAGL